MAWLDANQPEDVANCVIHNDFKIDNMVFDYDDPTRVVGVLDWEMATLGDPLMDVGGALAFWIQADDSDELKLTKRVPTDLPGMITREEFVQAYCERMGFTLTPEQWRFYEVFGLFRNAVIAQQIYYRYFHKQTTNELFAMFGPGVQILDRRIAELLFVSRDPPGAARPGVVGCGGLRPALRPRRRAVAHPGSRARRAGHHPRRTHLRRDEAARPDRGRRLRGRRLGPPGHDRRRVERVRPPPDAGPPSRAGGRRHDRRPTRLPALVHRGRPTRWTGGEHDDYDETFADFCERVSAALDRAVAVPRSEGHCRRLHQRRPDRVGGLRPASTAAPTCGHASTRSSSTPP